MVDLSLGTILAQMLNFFILVWLLARFAYKPLLAMMTERKERIAKDLEAAEKARVEAEGFKADYAAQIAKARQEAQQIVEKAIQEAENTTREQLQNAASPNRSDFKLGMSIHHFILSQSLFNSNEA